MQTTKDFQLLPDDRETLKRWLRRSTTPSGQTRRATSASWLNAVETWFGQLERRALRRGVFTSVSDLRDEIRRFIETHNRHSAKPFRWTKAASVILDAVERARQSLRQETFRTGR